MEILLYNDLHFKKSEFDMVVNSTCASAEASVQREQIFVK